MKEQPPQYVLPILMGNVGQHWVRHRANELEGFGHHRPTDDPPSKTFRSHRESNTLWLGNQWNDQMPKTTSIWNSCIIHSTSPQIVKIPNSKKELNTWLLTLRLRQIPKHLMSLTYMVQVHQHIELQGSIIVSAGQKETLIKSQLTSLSISANNVFPLQKKTYTYILFMFAKKKHHTTQLYKWSWKHSYILFGYKPKRVWCLSSCVVEPTHLKNMFIKLDHFPNNRGENKNNWNHQPVINGHFSKVAAFLSLRLRSSKESQKWWPLQAFFALESMLPAAWISMMVCSQLQTEGHDSMTLIQLRRGTLQGINISHLGKRKIIFKMPFFGGYVSFLEGWTSKPSNTWEYNCWI